MSGRAYTIKEMSTIVEYVNKRKAYGEIRGRKLWTDFASSNLTNRTWQSLKETFLKRILPDIHNPYYGLTKSEICSFKQGYDVDTRSNNKLEIQTISDESNHSHAGNVQEDEKPSTSKNNEANKSTGEKVSPSTLHVRTRASTETVILDNCYETAEDIQRDLESPKNNKTGDNSVQEEKETPSKCLRDLITYAEPFTPMMQQVLDDFATEDELVEADLEILESTNSRNRKIENTFNSRIEDNNTVDEISNKKVEDRISEIAPCSDSVKIPLGQETKISENNTANKSSDLIENVQHDSKKDNEVFINLDKRENIKKFVDLTNDTATTQNTNNSTDTIIPGNQEALKNKIENIELSKTDHTQNTSSKNLTLSRKRANSLEVTSNIDKKKRLGLRKIAQSETEDKSEERKAGKIPEKNLRNEENEKQTINNFETTKFNNVAVESQKDSFSQINPCLNSVSLYDEQFNKTKYTDSDSNDNPGDDAIIKNGEQNGTHSNIENKIKVAENNVENKVINKEDPIGKSPKVVKKTANINDVVILKSHSESDDSNEANSGQQGKVKQVNKKERENALASVFGFSSGVVSSSNKRRLSRLHRSPSYKHNASNSSEWTSESDSEYVSPPRGRRNRYGRKYLKPKSARILQLEEEGGLFVMHGKRIYPIVKDGNIVKNYLTFSPESDPEDDPSYWKKKYKEEKKKTEKLIKMVEETKIKLPIREPSPNQPTTSRQSILPQSPPKLIPISEEQKVLVPAEKPKQEVKSSDKTLKIKFTKNNEELQLEGSWSQIHPVLADVVQIFNKDTELVKEIEPVAKTNGKLAADDIVSLRSSPLDEEDVVRKKVEKMEEDIFKEIEELDKSEREQAVASAKEEEQDPNINTKKRGRPRKSSTALKSADSSSSPSVSKIAKENKGTEENGHLAVPKEEPAKRRTRSPKKMNNESTVAIEKTKKSPRSARKSRLEPESTRHSTDDEEIRYMFPPEKKARKSAGKTVARSLKTLIHTQNLSLNSIESSQGYQDSDPSPTKERLMLKRKRKLSLSNILHKGKQRRFIRRKSYPCVSEDASSESSNLSFKIPMKNTSASLKSEVYRSDSYQLLMPRKKQSYNTLEKIDELSPNFDTNNTNFNCNSAMDCKDILKIHCETFDMKNSSIGSGHIRSDGNSSNVSLPQSPELSIVENISVCKELVNSSENFPTINELQANNEPNTTIHNKYLMSAVDVTMPLMGQDCDIQKSITPDNLDHQNKVGTSDSLLNRINSVNITEGPTISDSLDSRLRNLLLESAKKMEVDTLETICEYRDTAAKSSIDIDKKSRAKKRCSTPHKRNSKKKSKIPEIEPVVEEERMEFCSYGGRKSCPPTIQILHDEINNNNENDDINNTETEPVKKGRKKKDVIKVKILKPNNKQKKVSPVKVTKKIPLDVTRISVHTDSGINETGSALFLQNTDDSVDLIHNHSETCLQTKECVGDSIEFFEHDTSIISINSQDALEVKDTDNIPPEVFCNNANHDAHIFREKTMTSQSTDDTIYHSPLASDMSANSLITEDLSDEIVNDAPIPRRAHKWYLFSEDETTNTNQAPSFGANLMQIFPLTCAVPDLSTITEMSKENDSRKPTLDADGETRNDFDSQSIF